MAKAQTEVKEISTQALDELLKLPDSEDVITSQNNSQTKSVLTDTNKQTEALLNEQLDPEDKELILKQEEEKKKADQVAAAAKKKAEDEVAGAQILTDLDKDLTDNTDDDEDPAAGAGGTGAGKTGRPKLDKSALVESLSELITEGVIVDFEYEPGKEKKIEEYSTKDAVELIKANFKDKEEKLADDVQKQFFESLSPQLKHLANFEYNGGKNLTPILEALLRVEKNSNLNPENEKDQEAIVRNYYHMVQFGSPEEIEAEITSVKDHNELEKKAKQFKPKLDARHAEQVQQDVKRQELVKKQQQEIVENYTKSVGTILQKGDLNGIKLDKKIQEKLFVGATASQYPTKNGSYTNLLGHLLEKHQVVEPNHALVLEALWLLSDPEEYKNKIRGAATTEQGQTVLRKLKDAEKDKTASSGGTTDLEDETLTKKQGVKRKNNNFFGR